MKYLLSDKDKDMAKQWASGFVEYGLGYSNDLDGIVYRGRLAEIAAKELINKAGISCILNDSENASHDDWDIKVYSNELLIDVKHVTPRHTFHGDSARKIKKSKCHILLFVELSPDLSTATPRGVIGLDRIREEYNSRFHNGEETWYVLKEDLKSFELFVNKIKLNS